MILYPGQDPDRRGGPRGGGSHRVSSSRLPPPVAAVATSSGSPRPKEVNPAGAAPLAVGDSVMLLALHDLAGVGYDTNGQGCRSFAAGLGVIRRTRRAAKLPPGRPRPGPTSADSRAPRTPACSSAGWRSACAQSQQVAWSGSYRVPWAFDDEAVDVARKFTRLKMSLMPYLAGSGPGERGGTPMLRPMVLEFPEDPATEHVDTQYMLGDSLLVAPVFAAHGRVCYYVPRGPGPTCWTDTQ